MQFPLSGGATHLDVDTLNERLRSNGAVRHRHALRPDEAHACVFHLENVLIDTRGVQRRAWMRLAEEEELPFPAVERQLFDIRPERVIMEVRGLQTLTEFRCISYAPADGAAILAGSG